MRLGLGTDISVGYRQPLFGGIPFLLDTYTGAAAAYSLRQLRTGVTNVVRVRRDTTPSAEQDFTAEEITDGTLLAFVGAGNNGYVVTWYDQSENGNDATQATAANQPKIVDSGVLVEENGKPAVDFDGVDDGLTLSSLTYSNEISLISIYNQTNGNYGRIWCDDITGQQGYWILYGQDGNVNENQKFFINDGTGFTSFTHQTAPINQQNLLGIYFTSSQIIDSLNGVPQTQSVSGFTPPINLSGSSANFAIGNAGNMTDATEMKAQEFILYHSDQSANRVGIETNINEHYSIYT